MGRSSPRRGWYQLFNVVDDFNCEALHIEVELKALESVGEGGIGLVARLNLHVAYAFSICPARMCVAACLDAELQLLSAPRGA
jgi:hypothetical protein